MSTIMMDSILNEVKDNLLDSTSWKASVQETSMGYMEVTIYSSKQFSKSNLARSNSSGLTYSSSSGFIDHLSSSLNTQLPVLRGLNPALLIIDAKSGGQKSLDEAKTLKEEYDKAFLKLAAVKKVLGLKLEVSPNDTIDALLEALLKKSLK